MKKIILIFAILFGCGGYGTEYALAQDIGIAVIHDRPDLFAAYHWLVKRHSDNPPVYAYDKRSGNTDSVIEIPGLHGNSGVITYADLSSAVLMPTQYAENIDIAVCTKTINAEGNMVDEGVWYFQWSDMTGRVRFKTSPDAAYANYGGANLVAEGRYDECKGNTTIDREKCVFFNRLRHAANRNR